VDRERARPPEQMLGAADGAYTQWEA